MQLDQLPKTCKYLSDLLLVNNKSKSGYSQIDHIIFSPFAVFVIETKNYSGIIYGDRTRKQWSVNGKFPMLNPFIQNYGHIEAIRSSLNSVENSNFVSMISFTKRCKFKVNSELREIQSNDLIVYDIELTEFITRKLNVLKLQKKTAVFSEGEILNMYNKLQKENIKDSNIRKNHIEIVKAENNGKKSINNLTNTSAKCVTCGKSVSQKVESFCLSNKERFNGNVYCYEHQKKH
ncbi:nuclease-related domain-containing protein [Domibacillus epiphyticus]|uniref:nuclease-related domain-containing protein n=1 Tax=Domibacillus epiphyticus TaxID=1714355 RepID=UPI001E467171|nr:nuclease-related domain-containing protein [Domibacillus epiphyticus]